MGRLPPTENGDEIETGGSSYSAGWVSIWKPPDSQEGPLYYAILGFDPGTGDGSRGKVESEESKDLYPRLRIQPLRGVGGHWLRGMFRTIDLRAAT